MDDASKLRGAEVASSYRAPVYDIKLAGHNEFATTTVFHEIAQKVQLYAESGAVTDRNF